MKTVLRGIANCFPILLFTLSCLLFITPVRAAQTLPTHFPDAIKKAQPLGSLASSARLRLVIGLPLRNQSALTNLLSQLCDPTSPNYHHYLTPGQFTEKFGPGADDYAALVAFAKAHGLDVTGIHPGRALLDVEGSVADIQRIFRVNLRVYQHPTEARTFFAPDAAPSLDVDFPVLDVIGLDNYVIPRPAGLHSALMESAGSFTPAVGSATNGTYLSADFRAAYVPGTLLTGAGQRVGLLELDGYYASDISNYESQAGLPNVRLSNVLLNGFSGLPGGNNDEVALDIEMAIAMAPGLSEVIVYEEANSSNNFPIDILDRMASDNLASQLSSSWYIGDNLMAQNAYVQFIAQGQSFFQASGDNGAYHQGTNQQSADDPYITIVGGTVLTTSGPRGSYISETTWSDSGGGISPSNAIPPWQQGISMAANQGSTKLRNVPDVAIVATNIYSIANNGQTNRVAGTSAAAPLWAGFAALVNQQNQSAIGFFNPALYAIAKGSNYTLVFHDITTGNNTNSGSSNQFFAIAGYDLCTGLGTPAGTNLINLLAPSFENVLAIGGLINFSANKTIAPSTSYQISNNTVLDGTGYNVVFSGSGTSAVFIVQPGISFSATNVTFANCQNVSATGASGTTNFFSGNSGNPGSAGSNSYGGAIYNQGIATLVDCSFLTNSATGGAGGAGGVPPSGGYQGGNGATGGNGLGGAIYNLASILLSNCTFTGNTAIGGNGGASPSGTQGGGPGGSGALGQGAAIYNMTGASATILACTFNNNSVTGGNTQQAGGSFNGNVGDAGLTGGAAQGGAIYNLGTNTIINSTFYANSAMGGNGGAGGIAPPNAGGNGLGGNGGTGGAAYGGSIYNIGFVSVTNCTFDQGSALGGTGGSGTSGPFRTGSNGLTGMGYGANLDNNTGTLDLKNSILAYPNNVANAFGTITDEGNNISSDATPAFSTTNSHDNLDPKLSTLGSNGGFTETVALLPGSPAIDAIYDGSAPSVDQRGVARPSGLRPDIGALEYTGGSTTVLSLNSAAQISGSMSPNLLYRIQTSTNLVTWQDLATNNSGPSGKINFTDTNPASSQRFYRTVVP